MGSGSESRKSWGPDRNDYSSASLHWLIKMRSIRRLIIFQSSRFKLIGAPSIAITCQLKLRLDFFSPVNLKSSGRCQMDSFLPLSRKILERKVSPAPRNLGSIKNNTITFQITKLAIKIHFAFSIENKNIFLHSYEFVRWLRN